MISVIKIGDNIYTNIEPYYIDKRGKKIWNIPTDPAALKNTLFETLGWVVSQRIVRAIGDANKKDASTSKAVVLLAKLVDSLSPDASVLTETERSAYEKMLALAEAGYSDSALLDGAFDALAEHLAWYADRAAELEGLSAFEDLAAFAEAL
ncbi:hypothetical protein [Hydrogenimonas sp.]